VTTHRCESCGEELPDEGLLLGAPSETARQTPGRTRKSGGEKKWLVAGAAVVAAWALFVGLGQLVSPDSDIDAEAAADLQQARIDREVADALAKAEAERETAAAVQAETEATEPVEEPGEADTTVDASNLGARTNTIQVERLQRQLARRSTSPIVAYQSEEGIALIDLVAGRSWLPEVGMDVSQAASGDAVFRSGVNSYVVNPDTLEVTLMSSDSSMVLTDAKDGNLYLIDAATLTGQGEAIEVRVGTESNIYRMPPGGLQLLPIDGLGLLAVPKSGTGETLIATETEFVPFRQDRVLTGTSSALLEQSCTAGQGCRLQIDGLLDDDRVANVPSSFVRFGDRYVLSPDGSGLLRYSPEGFGEVFVTGTDTIAWVIGAGMDTPVWGPNSTFIAWIDRIGEPELKVMFPDERDWLEIDFADYGAPAPIGPELLVFAPSD